MKTIFEIATDQSQNGSKKREIQRKILNLFNYSLVTTVLVQNHTKGPFDAKYIGDYHVVSIKGNQD